MSRALTACSTGIVSRCTRFACIACLAEGGYLSSDRQSLYARNHCPQCTQARQAPPTPPPTPPPPTSPQPRAACDQSHMQASVCLHTTSLCAYLLLPLPRDTSLFPRSWSAPVLLQERPALGYCIIKGRCTMSGGARGPGGDAKGADNTPPADAAVALMFLTVRLPWPVFPARRSLWRVLLHKSTGSGPEPIAGARAPAGGWRHARAHTLRCVPIVFTDAVVRSRPVLRSHHNKLATGRGRGLCKL